MAGQQSFHHELRCDLNAGFRLGRLHGDFDIVEWDNDAEMLLQDM